MLNQISLIGLLVPLFLALREGLEAVLVVVILLLYLKKTEQKFYYKYVYVGITLAIASSVTFALFFTALFGGFTGILEQLFEGITFIVSGIFILTLIFWISKEGPKMRENLEEKVEESIKTQKMYSISIISFIIILREGIELILLLTGASSIGALDPINVILGSLTGLCISIFIGFLVFFGIKSLNLKLFFKATNIILILFAVGLITFGIHEFIEAGIINPIIEEFWNIKHILPESYPDGNPSTPVFLEVIGALLKALFGYNANPSLLEVIIYPILLASICLISVWIWRKNK